MLSGVTVGLVCRRRRRLTAFVVRCFNQAKGYIFIDQGKVNQAVDFILQQQNRDGTFRVSAATPSHPLIVSQALAFRWLHSAELQHVQSVMLAWLCVTLLWCRVSRGCGALACRSRVRCVTRRCRAVRREDSA